MWPPLSPRIAALALALLAAGCAAESGGAGGGGAAAPTAQAAPVEAVCFAPPMDCAGVIAGEIGRAQRELLIQAYGFTDPRVGAAILAAHARGVVVSVILDRSNRADRRSLAPLLQAAGIPVRADLKAAIAHNKVMVIDRRRVITGSYNFTRAANTRNAENLVVLQDPPTVALYAANFDRRLALSAPIDTVRPRRHRTRVAQGS